MIPWVIAISLFWMASAVYLGGLDVRIEGGGGVRQLLGLIDSFVLFLLVWWVLRRLLGGLGPVVGGILVPSAVAVLLLPLLTRLGFRLLGVRVGGRAEEA